MDYDLRYFVLGLINWLIRPQLSLLFLSSTTHQDDNNSSSIALLPRLALLSLFFILFLFTSFKLAPQTSFVIVRHHHGCHLRRHGCRATHFDLTFDNHVGVATGGEDHPLPIYNSNSNSNNDVDHVVPTIHVPICNDNNNSNTNNNNSNNDEDHVVPTTGGDNLSRELRRRAHYAGSEVSNDAGGDDRSGEARRRSHYDSEGNQSSSELRRRVERRHSRDCEVVCGGDDDGVGCVRWLWVEFGYEQRSVLVITALSLSLLCSTPVFQCIHPWIILASLCPSFSRKFLGQVFLRFRAAFSAFLIISHNAIDFPSQFQGGDSMV